MSTPPPLQTRKPTGLPSWPLGLIAGVEGAGKSIKLAEASASDLIHKTFWIGCGEDDPDEYGAFVTADGRPADFDIVLHDGTYRGVLNAIVSASAQPVGPLGQPNLIVFDSGSRFWIQLAGNMQETANDRKKAREAKFGNRNYVVPEDGVQITMDLWNTAKDRWNHVLDALREHQGPTLITSRLDLVTVMENGEPTKEKHWKVQAEKNLPYEVGFVIQMRGSYPVSDDYLLKVKSLRYKHELDPKGRPKLRALEPGWTIEGLWKQIGLEDKVGARTHAHVVQQGDDSEAEARSALLNEVMEYAGQLGISTGQVAEQWGSTHNGQRIDQTSDLAGLARVRDDLLARAEATAPPAQPQGEPDPAVGIEPDEARALTQETRAPESAPAEQPRAQESASAQPEPAQSAPPVTREQKHLALVREELTYQSQVLGVPFHEYAKDLVNAEGGVDFGKAQKYAVQQRAKVIEALRAAGEATIAARYEGYGDSPLLVIDQVVAGGDYQREAAPQGQRA